jgi:hypothetical protein
MVSQGSRATDNRSSPATDNPSSPATDNPSNLVMASPNSPAMDSRNNLVTANPIPTIPVMGSRSNRERPVHPALRLPERQECRAPTPPPPQRFASLFNRVRPAKPKG